MESLDHCAVTREALCTKAETAGLGNDRLFIPADGKIVCQIGTYRSLLHLPPWRGYYEVWRFTTFQAR